MRYSYTAVLTPEEDGQYMARVPDLPGCVSSGCELEEAVIMITDAMGVWLCTAEDYGDEVIRPTPHDEVAHKEGESCVLIQVDTQQFRERA